MKSFKKVGVSWLHKDQSLPDDLNTWLAVPWLNEPVPSVPASEELRAKMFKLITPRDYGSDEESIQDVTNDLDNSDCHLKSHPGPGKLREESIIPLDDAGEIINREAYESRIPKEEPPKNSPQDKIHTEAGLKQESKKRSSHVLLTFDNAKNKSDLLELLNRKAYPGLDKLRWNIVSKKGKKLLCKIETCPDEKRQLIMVKKAIKRIREWIL